MIRGVDEDVPRLDVAVHEPPPVGGVERFGDLTDESQRTLGRKRPFVRQNRPKIGAVHVPGREIQVAARFAGCVDGEDPGMIERGREARLAQEALVERAIVRKLGRDQLQRDRPVERELGRPVDDPHAAATDDTVDPIAGQLRSELR